MLGYGPLERYCCSVVGTEAERIIGRGHHRQIENRRSKVTGNLFNFKSHPFLTVMLVAVLNFDMYRTLSGRYHTFYYGVY